ncbi:GFA family protein [Nioella sp.]|uniref:GFA family protein n=1 Tax=Nioella sp. TaxID=1912091 RepID=UPI003B51632E
MGEDIKGGCLCGGVEYTIENDFQFLLFCHCEQCRRISGSAHASNLFSAESSLSWVKGAELVKCFHHPSRDFTKAFCSNCGSGLPYVSKSGAMVIVPAGSLYTEPRFKKAAKVFLSECANWTPASIPLEDFERFPSYFSD